MMENVCCSLVHQVLSPYAKSGKAKMWSDLTLTALQNYKTRFDSVLVLLAAKVNIKQSYSAILLQIFSGHVINLDTL